MGIKPAYFCSVMLWSYSPDSHQLDTGEQDGGGSNRSSWLALATWLPCLLSFISTSWIGGGHRRPGLTTVVGGL